MVNIDLRPGPHAIFVHFATGLMPEITPTHSCDGAQFGKPEAALQPFIFVADET
jgi:hypothetical protein